MTGPERLALLSKRSRRTGAGRVGPGDLVADLKLGQLEGELRPGSTGRPPEKLGAHGVRRGNGRDCLVKADRIAPYHPL